MIRLSHRIAYLLTATAFAVALAFTVPARSEELTECYDLDQRLQNSVNSGEDLEALLLLNVPADKVNKLMAALIAVFGPPPAHWHVEDVVEIHAYMNAITGATSLIFNDDDGCSWTRGLNVRDPRVLDALLKEAGIDFSKEMAPGAKSFPDMIKEKGIVKLLDKSNTY